MLEAVELHRQCAVSPTDNLLLRDSKMQGAVGAGYGHPCGGRCPRRGSSAVVWPRGWTTTTYLPAGVGDLAASLANCERRRGSARHQEKLVVAGAIGARSMVPERRGCGEVKDAGPELTVDADDFTHLERQLDDNL